MLLALAKKDFLPQNPTKREELLSKYSKYIIPLEEAEWYGLTLQEALEKLNKDNKLPVDNTPLKVKFRDEFIQQLKEEKKEDTVTTQKPSNWAYLNPFKSNKTV